MQLTTSIYEAKIIAWTQNLIHKVVNYNDNNNVQVKPIVCNATGALIL